MAKDKTFYECQECGYKTPKWLGKCPACQRWDTFVAQVERKGKNAKKKGSIEPISLPDIKMEGKERFCFGLEEVDRPLGGGLVPGSITLLAGNPGIGKSTLLLQLSHSCAYQGNKVIYVSGEESSEQIKMRADRIKACSPNILLYPETSVDRITETVEKEQPTFLIVDSVQTVFTENIPSPPGSLAQIREVTYRFMQLAKENGISTFLAGHVTKDGAIAGPRVLEHIVDTVLYMEGERYHAFRLLRTVKNRFGSTNEIGVLKMSEQGLEEVLNPSELFISQRSPDVSGSSICSCMEGSRPLLVELQFLVTGTWSGSPRRGSVGIDINRFFLLLAVLEKRIGFSMAAQDIFGNAAGGIKVDEPAADLAICAAIISSAYNQPLSSKLVIIGEVGLGGEVRGVSHIESRIGEAIKLGFKEVMIPQGNAVKLKKAKSAEEEFSVIGVESVSQAMEILFPSQKDE